jgi:hypothetical protein
VFISRLRADRLHHPRSLNARAALIEAMTALTQHIKEDKLQGDAKALEEHSAPYMKRLALDCGGK